MKSDLWPYINYNIGLTNLKTYGISSGGGKFLGFVMSWFGEIKVWIVMSFRYKVCGLLQKNCRPRLREDCQG